VRCRRSGLIAEYRCEGLEAAADVAQSFAVAREVGRLLPCLLEMSTLAGAVTVVKVYQYLVVSLAEACQTLLRVVRGGLLLLLGRAAE
jgi:hypothetical protein